MTQRNKHRSKHQRGVAIITALLIVAIAATISITISTSLQLDVRRTANLIALDQADLYIVQMEEFAKQQFSDEDAYDVIVEEIGINGSASIPYQVDQATLLLQLTDLQACINVNSLVENNTINPTTEARLRQLFSNLGINQNLTQSITDWIDSGIDDQTTIPDGAEDGYYLNLDKPYRTANQPLQSISELRLIRGFENNETYDLVKDQLCAFLAPTDIGINVSTAKKQVLMSLSPNMNESLVNAIIERQKDGPFSDKQEFTSFSNVNTIIPNDTPQISVSSEYYLLKIQATIGHAKKIAYSIIRRDAAGGTAILARTQRTL